jgi:hypothetical protein
MVTTIPFLQKQRQHITDHPADPCFVGADQEKHARLITGSLCDWSRVGVSRDCFNAFIWEKIDGAYGCNDGAWFIYGIYSFQLYLFERLTPFPYSRQRGVSYLWLMHLAISGV